VNPSGPISTLRERVASLADGSPHDYVRALVELAKALPPGEEKIERFLEVADLYANRFMNHAEAIPAYEAVLEIDPRNATAVAFLRNAYEKRRDHSKLDALRQSEREMFDGGAPPEVQEEVPQSASDRIGKGHPQPSRATGGYTTWLPAVLASLLSAAAVDLGFGGAFVSDGVAWGTTAYATAFAVLMASIGGGAHFSERVWVRIPLAFSVGGLTLALLRGPLLFSLPEAEFVTTGHTPYVVFPSATVASLALLWALKQWGRPRSKAPSPLADQVDSRVP
jgi:hypothetical protein